jgi:hypothetical protein
MVRRYSSLFRAFSGWEGQGDICSRDTVNRVHFIGKFGLNLNEGAARG